MIDILSLIFGILSLILFFKMWVMTEDVRKIKEKLVPYENKINKYSKDGLEDNVRKELVFGNIDGIKNLFLQKFIN